MHPLPPVAAVAKQKQWGRDNARMECQELLATVALTFQAMMAWDALRNKVVELNKEEAAFKQYEAAYTEMHKTINTRLLIAKQVNEAKLVHRWEVASIQYMDDCDSKKFAATYDDMHNSIIEIGLSL